jgi:hypothetical protein
MAEETTNFLLSDSTIETVDTAFYKFVDEQLNLSCTTSDGFKKVPVIWAFAERAYQIKNNKEIRDKYGALITPVISIERSTINKDVNKKGIFQGNLSPYNDRNFIGAKLRQDKTSKFANADTLKSKKQINFITSKQNTKKVYDFYAIPVPVYITIEYKVSILTSYQQQMNELIQPLITKTGALNYFIISHESHRFECFIDSDFSQANKGNLDENERKYVTDIKIKVLGHLIGDGVNQDRKEVEKIQNAVEIKFPKENLAFIQEEAGQKKINNLLRNAGTQITSNVAVKKTFVIGNNIDSVYVIGHGLNTRDAYISVRYNFPPDYEKVEVAISFTDLNNISIDMGDIIPTDSYVVTIIG